jgi:hypothetical protein
LALPLIIRKIRVALSLTACTAQPNKGARILGPDKLGRGRVQAQKRELARLLHPSILLKVVANAVDKQLEGLVLEFQGRSIKDTVVSFSISCFFWCILKSDGVVRPS